MIGYSVVTGGFRPSNGTCGTIGPLVPTIGPGAGVIGVIEAPGNEVPPATVVVSNVVGVGGM